jgi:hypothetical protein
MLHVFEATNEDERNLHIIFQQKRIRGEWFDLNGSDIELVKGYFEKNMNFSSCPQQINEN